MDNEFYRFEDEDAEMDEILNHAYDRWERSNEEQATDAILNRAFDRWEQTGGGGTAGGPLFQFTMHPIGKRRTWRNVVERAQFHAQLQQMRQPVSADNIGLALTEALYNAVETELLKQNRPAHHFVNLAITANAFQHAYQTVNFTVGEFLQRTSRLDEMLAKLAGKLNSNEAFNPDGGFQVDVVMVSMPGPGTGHRKKHNPGRLCLDRENKKKRCIIAINNNDQLCCARAIVTMRAHCHKQDGVDALRLWDSLKKGYPVQQRQAQELHQQAGVAEGPCGLEELRQFQQALGCDYQLLVMTRIKPFFLIFKGPDAPNQIRLLKSNDHFDGCTSFPAFVNRSYYCVECERGFNTNDRTNHICQGRRCSACGSFDCKDYVRGTRPTEYCSLCHCKFYGPYCKHHHVVTKQCQSLKTCLKCQAQYTVVPHRRHNCGVAKCPVCAEWVSINDHRCFIQPVKEKEEKEEETEEPTEEGGGGMMAPPPPLFVYADYETMLNEEGVFVANLLCYSTTEEEDIHALQGEDCSLQFLEEMDELVYVPDSDSEREIIIVFHNFKGFDSVFIVNELYRQQREVTEQLTVGAKVLSFRSGPLKFIDSLSFLPIPLSSFSSTFNLTELKKGFFPHLFNLPHHQNYVGRIPDIEFYDPDGMMPSKKEELLRWHADQVQRNVTFNFKQEMIAYCHSDVALLKAGCIKFQQEFENQAAFNPMEKCITIASACNLYWRMHHLPPNTIAVEPLRGWRGAQVNHSLKALQWLYFQEHQIAKQGASPDRIKHVRNGGEQSVRTPTNIYFVDGYDPTTKTVYEFHGCLFHGCPTCYPIRSVKHYATPDRTVEELFNATEAKRMVLLRAGYTVFEMWECQWEKIVDTNADVQCFLASLELVPPLEPRDAFFGGRTGAVALHAVAGEGEEIRYVDVTSLYPWVNKNCTYAVGHPQIITQPADQSIHSYFGIATVDILPPPGLFHPVLPVRAGGKLMFPLCRSCVEKEQAKTMLSRSHYCPHSDAERTLRGTWCTPEIEKAIEKGYTLIKIHEVWNFPPQQRQTGLFKDYVNTWLKLKQESAGWPSWCQTLEQKRNYILRYEEQEGIRLDISQIAKNPGRKATAKLALNRYLFHVAIFFFFFFFHTVIPPFSSLFHFPCSFWGKFGERINKPTTVTVQNPGHLFSLISDDALNISTLRLCTDDIMEVVYTSVQDNVVKGTKTNIFVAAFTTSYARLKLYETLDVLQQQVLYYDTDSVVYRWQQGHPSIATGDYLGQMKDELEGDVIKEFISAGAKNYGYVTQQGKVECKVRGFTLSVRGANVLNFQTMKDNILDELNNPLDHRRTTDVVTPYYFQRDSEKKQIKVVPRVKKYALVFDKRVVDVTTQTSYPFGYQRIGNELNLLLDL